MPVPSIVGILLAAGRSSRFGSDKLLHPLADGTPMAVAAARKLRAACPRTLAVVRPGGEALSALLKAEGCEVVISEASIQGMGHSLADGIRAAPDAPGWLIALADMPFIAPATCRAVADALIRGASIALPTYEGKRGHPVGFDRGWYADLTALTGDAGARTILAAHREQIQSIPLDDPGIFRDVDAPQDLDSP